jgi:hypothetical protein
VTWSKREMRVLDALSTPAAVQLYLDALPYRCEDGHLSARAALRDGRAHCFDGALLAAAALRRHGFTPYIIDLCATEDDDHLLCAYTTKGRWGAVAKSNFPGLRLREPIFRTPRELVLSYFEFYFNLKRKKTLRAYSRPFRLPSLRRVDWECDDSAGELIVELLSESRHYRLLTPYQEQSLAPVDKRLFESQLVGVDMRGAYGSKNKLQG